MWKNQVKTFILLATLSGLLLFVGNLLGGMSGIAIAFVLAIAMNGVAYFFSDKIVLAMYGAQPLSAQQYPNIVAIVQELSDRMQIPMPKLWIIETPVANAFATGRNPQHSSIALTTGILRLLETHELRGVLAHEMSHIYNRDILVGTIAATIATAIGYAAHMARHAFFWSSWQQKNSEKNSGGIIGLLCISIFMPIAATIVQLGVSRSREYLADETGAHMCHDPLALASALKKLHNHTHYASFQEKDSIYASTASLFIVCPLSTSQGLLELFATHPPLEKRIDRLHRIHEDSMYQVK